MALEKRLGKITAAHFGFGGYQAAQFGASFSLLFEGESTNDFWGFWALEPSSKHSQWNKADQIEHLGRMALRVRDLLEAAKVQYIDQLVGKPVEVTCDLNQLVSWRILTEVL